MGQARTGSSGVRTFRLGVRSSLRCERGAMLVEAMVGASLLVILALGFLAALDTAARSSGDNKSRSIAATLAQEDMERLRALKLTDLTSVSESRTQTVGGVSYTIASKAAWVDDVTGNATCLGGTSTADYMKVSSTVTWASMGIVKPIKSESIVSVPNGSFGSGQGSIQAKILDRSAAGVPNVAINLSGPANTNGVTDSGGCAFWGYLPVGTYTASFSQSGWVNRAGTQDVTQATSVTGGNTTNLVFDYDRAADLDAGFDTRVGSVTQAARAKAIMVANSGLPSPSTRTFSSATLATLISSDFTLYPFTDGYAVWAGACAGADPRVYGQSAPIVTIGPAATQAVTLRVPALNIQVRKAGVPFPTARVRVRPMTAGCGSTFDGPLNSTANLQEPGLPYGDYQVCADDGIRRVTTSTIQNRAPNGTSTTTITIPTSGGTSGICS